MAGLRNSHIKFLCMYFLRARPFVTIAAQADCGNGVGLAPYRLIILLFANASYGTCPVAPPRHYSILNKGGAE